MPQLTIDGRPCTFEGKPMILQVALEHGKDRRHAGYADGVIFREYHLLRRFLWDELKQVGASQQAIVGAILHIDTAMTAATSGSIHGYYLIDRPTDEDELVKRLVDDWNMPLR